jgi:hypothetical protein
MGELDEKLHHLDEVHEDEIEDLEEEIESRESSTEQDQA